MLLVNHRVGTPPSDLGRVRTSRGTREIRIMRQASISLPFTLLAVLVVSLSCGQTSSEGSNVSSQPAATKQAAPAPGESTVERIVFIDQEQACECTKNRIDGSWTALQAALGASAGIAVERVHRDTQEEQAEEYGTLRPMVTVPGIYLLDENGAIVELLQGEVTEEQLRTALGPRRRR